MKVCSKCGIEKELDEFYKDRSLKSGLQGKCKDCSYKYHNNWRVENLDVVHEKDRKYRIENLNNEHERKKKWIIENPDKVQAQRSRARSRVGYRIHHNISNSILKSLKKNGSSKRGFSCLQFLPYTVRQLKDHIESQFDCCMSWENHGRYDSNRYTWQIDHIIPQSALPYDSMEHPNFQKCWALSNLRPLKAIDNMKKGNRCE